MHNRLNSEFCYPKYPVGFIQFNNHVVNLMFPGQDCQLFSCQFESKAIVQRCSAKKAFLKISQNLQENTSAHGDIILTTDRYLLKHPRHSKQVCL